MARLLSIIIPSFNEERTIDAILTRVIKTDIGLWKKEIIIVDDGSTDTTRTILERYSTHPECKVIFQKHNGGKGVAERAGIAVAQGDYIILQDADLEYDPNDYRKLLAVVEATNAPIVFGSRLAKETENIKRPFGIWLGVRVSTLFINLLYGLHLTDAWTCYKLFSKEVARRARFIGNRFEADYLFIGEAASKGFRILEVPISYTPRSAAEGKKIRYQDGLYAMALLSLHWITHVRIARYLISGGIATALNLLLLYLGTDGLGLHYLLSSIISFSIATVASFLLQKFWTFKNASLTQTPAEFSLYLVLTLFNLVLNSALMFLFVSMLNVWYLFAQIITAAFIAIESYLFYKFAVFRSS